MPDGATDEQRFCSRRCRTSRPTASELAAEASLVEAVATSGRMMVDPVAILENSGLDRERVRQAARRVVSAGLAVCVQQGKVVDPSTAKGPFLLRATR